MLVTIWATIIFVLGTVFGMNKSKKPYNAESINKSERMGKPVFLRNAYPLKKEIFMYRAC
jgi:hypothetical protein